MRNNVTSIQAPSSLSERVQQGLQDGRLAFRRSSQSKGRPDSDGIPQFTKGEVEEMLAALPDDDVDDLWRDYENTKHKERQ